MVTEASEGQWNKSRWPVNALAFAAAADSGEGENVTSRARAQDATNHRTGERVGSSARRSLCSKHVVIEKK